MEASRENEGVKIGGWTYEAPKHKSKKNAPDNDLTFEIEDERLKQDNEIEDFIDNIPDLDEMNEGDLVSQVAAPPSAAVQQITTYKQLDNDLAKHASLFTMDGEIDLKALAQVISPESEIQEDDKVWEWDKLFAEVSHEIESTWRQDQPQTLEGLSSPSNSSTF
ncbi:PREDICTED: intraflagellar transport protein 43 homolog A-like [Amphimedon queenslandica]|uniref:Intraflagellar transport protein 43 homolog n=1 Tax=Amphimedon queenslandica TaxID=400682 RepID=A0A1X7U3I4_AMPQE|nr:PREDICTED: intraflagellar transport protein 43 homolog A-like [Amphimedon queenslandica]|eukprot:XP_011406124.1 PREDICTED: intraflagellar transport protein 43 homolog A-like [Amphimedon queenslandica]